MDIYILACSDIASGGGIYQFDLSDKGQYQLKKYYACDKPMYAVKCKYGLAVLLRKPFKKNDESGYFFIDKNLENPTSLICTKGKVACHLDADDDDIYVVNYLSANIVKNGELVKKRKGKSINPVRQEEPHPHFIQKTFDNNLIAADLGTDCIVLYDKNLNEICCAKVPDGYGIRHLIFSKDKQYVYSINELIPSISIFRYNEKKIEYLHSVLINCQNKDASGGAIRISDDGKYLYASIRGENQIVQFEIDKKQIKELSRTFIQGQTPRDFNIFKDILLSANQDSNSISIFKIEKNKLIFIDKISDIPCPLCIL